MPAAKKELKLGTIEPRAHVITFSRLMRRNKNRKRRLLEFLCSHFCYYAKKFLFKLHVHDKYYTSVNNIGFPPKVTQMTMVLYCYKVGSIIDGRMSGTFFIR